MARAQPAAEAAKERASFHIFRNAGITITLGIAAIAFTLYTATRWVEHQILTVDNWVAYSSALPKNPEVSKAVANTITQQIYDNVPVEEKVKEALPPKASFLAGPLSEQLQTRTASAVQRVETSDAFTSLWTGANRLAIERFLNNARSNKAPLSSKIHDKFNIDMSSIKPILQKRLGSAANVSPVLQEKSQQALQITADLQTKRQRLWQAVRTTDFIHAVLPTVFLTSLLGMLVLARNRRRSIMVLGSVIICLLLVELIAIRFGRQRVLDQVQDTQNIPAVSFIYDSLLINLKHIIYNGLWIWLIVLGGCLLASPAHWAVRLRDVLHFTNVTVSRPANWWRTARVYAAKYRRVSWGVVAGLALLYLAFAGSGRSSALMNTLLVAMSGVFLVQLLADSHAPYAALVKAPKPKAGFAAGK